MPLPKPRSGQGRKKWLASCMANPKMNSEYPDAKQRYAICNSQWRSKSFAQTVVDIIDRFRKRLEPTNNAKGEPH